MPLIIGPVEPFERYTHVPLTPAHIHFQATSLRRLQRIYFFQKVHQHTPTPPGFAHSPPQSDHHRQAAQLRKADRGSRFWC